MNKWFEFNQNNSGGSFDYNEEKGITHYVCIEARDVNHAIERAKEIGIYFDGCEKGMDCDCCGDRWSTPWDEEGKEFPSVYDQNIRANNGFKGYFGSGWMDDGKEVCVHPMEGEIEWYGQSRDEDS